MAGGKRKASDMDEAHEVDETPRKMSKREKRQLAIARAQKAMEADRKKVEAVKAKKAGKPIPEEPKVKEVHDEPMEETTPKNTRTPKRATPSHHQSPAPATNDEEMNDVSIEDFKPAVAAIAPPADPTPERKSPPSFAGRTAMSRNSKTIVAAAAAAATAATTKNNDDGEDDDDDDDEMPPPMPSLEVQISQQVLANLAATEKNKPTPHTEPPPAAFANPPEVDADDDVVDEFVHDDNPIVIDEDYPADEEPKAKSSMNRSLLIVAVLVVVVGYILTLGESDNSVGNASVEVPCFKDNLMIDDGGVIINSCAGNTGVECPDGGTCKFGKLVDCIGKHYEISDRKDKCVLTPLSLEKVYAIKAVLEEMTLQGGCHLSARDYPLFAYSDVQLKNPLVIANNALELGILENEFNVERINGSLHIGLPADFKLKQPVHCKVTSIMASILGSVGSMVIATFHFLLAIALEIFRAYPIPSTIALVSGYFIRRLLQYRLFRRELASDISEIRQIAYDYLEDSAEQSHLVLHVRDHIVMNLYPKNKRNYLIQDVWPRVVPDFKCDNRIRKTTRVVEGQPREAWQWVAARSAKKKPLGIQ